MSASTASAVTPRTPDSPSKKPVSLKAVWPMIWQLVKPRSLMLCVGFLLVIIKSVCGLVLPGSSKFLIDDVLGMRSAGAAKDAAGIAAKLPIRSGMLDHAWAPALAARGRRGFEVEQACRYAMAPIDQRRLIKDCLGLPAERARGALVALRVRLV